MAAFGAQQPNIGASVDLLGRSQTTVLLASLGALLRTSTSKISFEWKQATGPMEAPQSEKMTVRELANIVYGVACCGITNWTSTLLKELARQMQQHVHAFKELDLSNTAWAFAKME